MPQKLEYINQMRCGYVVYKDDKNELKLFFEFGGGGCIVIIYIPTAMDWMEKTKIAVEDRDKILTFVAEQAIRDQAPGCIYQLTDDSILLLTKR